MTLIRDRIRTLERVNEALLKRYKAKRIRLQARGILTIKDGRRLIDRKEKNKLGSVKISVEGDRSEAGPSNLRRYNRCGKTGYNIRSC